VPKTTNDGCTGLTQHKMLYGCTNMATVGVKGLTRDIQTM